ncbi:MAG: response regulator [Anaerolineales bacterium]|nr:response regulator [Anaerolineales bacterium]
MARILIVEDNPDNMELMVYLIQTFGHTVLEAENGEKGLEIVEQAIPDLILCDIQMPSIDGYEFLRRLKLDAKLVAVPVVAVTAYAMVGDRDKVLNMGFNGYIPKPINPETFVKEIESFLNSESDKE